MSQNEVCAKYATIRHPRSCRVAEELAMYCVVTARSFAVALNRAHVIDVTIPTLDTWRPVYTTSRCA